MSEAGSNDGAQATSTRPYLVRALHDWCTDNGFTPYIAVYVDRSVQVPMEYVKNNEIVLNVSFDATSGLKLGNDYIEFRARFGGVARDIVVPVDHVIAIYARENGQGMAFPVPATAHLPEADDPAQGQPADAAPVPASLKLAPVSAAPAPAGDTPPPEAPEPPPAGGKPALKRIK
jgi:stringent starvation protein B